MSHATSDFQVSQVVHGQFNQSVSSEVLKGHPQLVDRLQIMTKLQIIAKSQIMSRLRIMIRSQVMTRSLSMTGPKIMSR